MNNLIVAFLRKEDPDIYGRMIVDIWNYSYEELEDTHDYIQWLFPLFETSAHSSNAPVLTISLAEKINADEVCNSSLKHSLVTMHAFYDGVSHWARHDDHNLLRITRILKSSALLIGKKFSRDFFDFIMQRCRELNFKPSSEVMEFWNSAMNAEISQYREMGC